MLAETEHENFRVSGQSPKTEATARLVNITWTGCGARPASSGYEQNVSLIQYVAVPFSQVLRHFCAYASLRRSKRAAAATAAGQMRQQAILRAGRHVLACFRENQRRRPHHLPVVCGVAGRSAESRPKAIPVALRKGTRESSRCNTQHCPKSIKNNPDRPGPSIVERVSAFQWPQLLCLPWSGGEPCAGAPTGVLVRALAEQLQYVAALVRALAEQLQYVAALVLQDQGATSVPTSRTGI